MKISKIVLFGLVLASSALFGLDDFKEVKNWNRRFASSGKLEIAWDDASEAMRFTASFGEKTKDRWVYPGIRVSEADLKADFLEFEIRVETNPEGGPVSNCLVLFQTPKVNAGQLYYPIPGKEFKKVKLDLRKISSKLPGVRMIKIGLNFKAAAEGSIWIRNIAFTTKK